MAKTVVGYFRNEAQAIVAIQKLVEQGNNPGAIMLTYDNTPSDAKTIDFDNTLEEAPVIAFRDALFGADITEEDAIYYNKLINEGDALVSVYVPTNPDEERDWEDKTAKSIGNIMAKNSAYDHEVRKIYSNRPGLTTYPQNRYSDPVGPNKLNRDSIYGSHSPLNGEVSNVIGVVEGGDKYDIIDTLGGRQIESGVEVLDRVAKAKK